MPEIRRLESFDLPLAERRFPAIFVLSKSPSQNWSSTEHSVTQNGKPNPFSFCSGTSVRSENKGQTEFFKQICLLFVVVCVGVCFMADTLLARFCLGVKVELQKLEMK